MTLLAVARPQPGAGPEPGTAACWRRRISPISPPTSRRRARP